MSKPGSILAVLFALAVAWSVQPWAQADVQAMFDQAEQEGRVGLARKTKPVDVRPALPGEVVVTIIAGEGKETESPPAQPGDVVVRNRCPARARTIWRSSRTRRRRTAPSATGAAPGASARWAASASIREKTWGPMAMVVPSLPIARSWLTSFVYRSSSCLTAATSFRAAW